MILASMAETTQGIHIASNRGREKSSVAPTFERVAAQTFALYV